MKDSPVDVRLKLHQRVFQLGEAFQKKMLVEKALRIDVFHDSRNDGMATAVKYEILLLYRYAICILYNKLWYSRLFRGALSMIVRCSVLSIPDSTPEILQRTIIKNFTLK